MSFWIVQAQENPAEPRSVIGRREWRSNMLAETLADRGHGVVRWRSAFSHQSKKFLANGNIAIAHDNYTQRFIACPPYRRHVGLSRILNHKALGKNFLDTARSCPAPRLIHVGNVPIELAYAAVRYGKTVGCPVVIDIRDLWPDIYVDLLPKYASFVRVPLLKLLKLTSLQLKWTMRNATAITALTQPYLEWGLEFANRQACDYDAVFAMCYPRRDQSPPASAISALRKELDLEPDDLVATYLGNIGYQSDFDLLIHAAKRLAKQFPKFKVVIAGSGPNEGKIRQLARGVDNVILPGWLQGDRLASLLHISKIGLIAFRPISNYLKNVPNKYSEYLAGEMAIACGLGGEMARLTQEINCGFVYPPGDLEALCTELTRVLADPALLDAMCSRAKALHALHFDSTRIYPAFADHLEHIARAMTLGE